MYARMYLCISLYNKTHAFVKIIKNIYIYYGFWDSIVSLITRLDDQGNKTTLLQNVQTNPGAHRATYSMSAGVLSQRYCCQSVKLTNHLHLVLMLMRSYTSTPYMCHHVIDMKHIFLMLITHTDGSTLYDTALPTKSYFMLKRDLS